MQGLLTGKVVVVTGAAGGIGSEVVRRCAEEGAAVLAVDRDAGGLDRVLAGLPAGSRVRPFAVDIAAPDAMAAAFGSARDAFGGVDVFHANAAVQVMGGLADTTAADWDRMYEVNQRAVAAGIREVVPHLRERGGGTILVTASLLALTGDADLPMYGATKGALRALCRSVAAAYGRDNIRCNTICPGDVDTPMVREFFDYQPDPDQARADVERKYPLGRLASPRDVAEVAVFLASDRASYLSGIDVVVDGGLLARIY
ncbi:SDR family NAD(P)-dependent oxidoreductase [Pseudonocardia acaciae]|uniref:SDR family NAD(P)-dependent oxidoreductase n=1 Tax=Pseudonocardia acaciae TaxID=551276 RepID=UPI000490F0B2|nr:SDR family oxidoreductase [Pseudonocardia acaciae]